MRAHRRVGAGIEAVVDPVAVGVGGTAPRVDDRAGGGAGAGILAVGDTVAVQVARFAAEERRQAQRADHVTGPIGAEAGLGARGVDAAHLEPQRDPAGQEDPVPLVGMNLMGGTAGGESKAPRPDATLPLALVVTVMISNMSGDWFMTPLYWFALAYAVGRFVVPRETAVTAWADAGLATVLLAATGGVHSAFLPLGIVICAELGVVLGMRAGAIAGTFVAVGSIAPSVIIAKSTMWC